MVYAALDPARDYDIYCADQEASFEARKAEEKCEGCRFGAVSPDKKWITCIFDGTAWYKPEDEPWSDCEEFE